MGGDLVNPQVYQGRHRNDRCNQIGGGYRHPHSQDQGSEGNQKDGGHQPEVDAEKHSTAGKLDNNIGKSQYQSAIGQHADNNTDNPYGGAYFETVFSAGPGSFDESFGGNACIRSEPANDNAGDYPF